MKFLRKYLVLILVILVPYSLIAMGISYEDETSYTSMRGSFVDGQSWWGGEILGAELVTNGTFNANITGWVNGGAPYAWDTWEWDAGGAIHIVSDGSSEVYGASADNIAIVSGTLYKLSISITITSGTLSKVRLRQASGSGSSYVLLVSNATTTGIYTAYITGTVTENCVIELTNLNTVAVDCLIDNVSVEPVTSLNTQSGTVSDGDLLILDDDTYKAYGYIKTGVYTNETLGSNLFDQDGGSGGSGDKGGFTLADLRLAELNSGNLTVGTMYEISARDDADFTTDGAPDNVVGTTFVATGTNVTLDAGDKVYPVDISWTPYGTNTMEIDSGALKITWVDNGNGAYLVLRDSTDFSADLEIGKEYKLIFDAKVGAGDTVNMQINTSAGNNANASVTATSFTPYEMYFTASSTTGEYFRPTDMDAANPSIWIDNLKLYEVTAPAANAVQIFKERGLVNQGWFEIEAGIDYNKGATWDFDAHRTGRGAYW